MVQWGVTILVLLPPFFLHWYTPLPIEKYCLVPYTLIGPEMYHIIILYLIPLVSIIGIYIWISTFVRRSTRAAAQTLGSQQHRRNQRDLTKIKRIILMISVSVLMRLPPIIFMIYAAIVGHLLPLTFTVVVVITSLCLTLIGVLSIYLTPRLHKNLHLILNFRQNQIHVGSNSQIATTTDSKIYDNKPNFT